jgi:heme/copper-type cytochrome/quinol oxidase subunit 2
MSDSHDSPTIPDLIKKFHFVGGVLVLGTIITFVIDIMFALPLALSAVIGLLIALVKASFVVAIFMHYKWDKKLIWITWTMVLTFLFFAGMMGLIMWAYGDAPNLARNEMHPIWVVLAALLGVALPASFTVFTVKMLSQPAPVEAAAPKAKRAAKKKG